ncbi:FAD/NAD(P)-binding domain-containing protein [Tothia fuscella]|uniref:FAD/NAD(P)-binding domain-containing protein n=1 Tax=Tothia fuscella TaxID=1048955 RepID=A0A9P4P1B2_9PEZI|nr:FAD/NAD(P)-binding domain-containing protein [Tothia fuscella]
MANVETKQNMNIIIAGGGIAGLTLANALQQAKIEYVLLEGRSEIAPQVGALIGLFANGCRILDQLGCFDDIWNHTEPLRCGGDHYENGDYTTPVTDNPQLLQARTGYPITFLDRQYVLQVLAEHIQNPSERLQLGKRIESVDHLQDCVVVHCTDGSSFRGDILIEADGVNSKCRHEMWAIADREDPGAIPLEDKTAMIAEYKCLYGISTNINMPSGQTDVTFAKDKSTLCFSGKDGRYYFFLFKKMDKVYHYPNIPIFTKADAEAFADSLADSPLQNKEGPTGVMNVEDVWKNRVSSTLVVLEEAEHKRWTWGRIACVGDSIHKMTPNAGAGGNNAIESACALANKLHDLQKSCNGRKPTRVEIETALTSYHKARLARITESTKVANRLTRIHALKGWNDKFFAFHLIPFLGGDFIAELQCDMSIGAEMLSFLPVPDRSLNGTMPFNSEQGVGKQESTTRRMLIALPFIALTLLAIRGLGPRPNVRESTGNAFSHLQHEWNLNSLPLIGSLLSSNLVKGNAWRLVAFFTRWNFGSVPIISWQLQSFLVDFGVLYMILLIEPTRRTNAMNLVPLFPSVFGVLAQIFGFGTAAPLYYFLSYIFTPIDKFRSKDQRLTNLRFTKGVLPAMPGPVSPGLPDTVRYDRLHAVKRDLPSIRLTVAVAVAASTIVWWYTIYQAPTSLVANSLPSLSSNGLTSMDSVRQTLQFDYILCFGGALLWLAYCFLDLKHAGMISSSWIRLIFAAVLTIVATGPGATIGLGWLWREETLATKHHKSAITRENLSKHVIREGDPTTGNGRTVEEAKMIALEL